MLVVIALEVGATPSRARTVTRLAHATQRGTVITRPPCQPWSVSPSTSSKDRNQAAGFDANVQAGGVRRSS